MRPVPLKGRQACSSTMADRAVHKQRTRMRAGTSGLEVARHARDRAAGARAGHEGVQASTRLLDRQFYIKCGIT